MNAWEQSLFSEFCDEIQPLPQNNDLSFNVESEMRNYLNFQTRPQPNQNIDNFDITAWWIMNRTSFPRLFAIFLRISSVQGTSASIERCFSGTGSIKTEKRARLKSLYVHDIMLVRTNLNQKLSKLLRNNDNRK